VFLGIDILVYLMTIIVIIFNSAYINFFNVVSSTLINVQVICLNIFNSLYIYIVLMAVSQDKPPIKMTLDQIMKTAFANRPSKTVHKELMNEIIKG